MAASNESQVMEAWSTCKFLFCEEGFPPSRYGDASDNKVPKLTLEIESSHEGSGAGLLEILFCSTDVKSGTKISQHFRNMLPKKAMQNVSKTFKRRNFCSNY